MRKDILYPSPEAKLAAASGTGRKLDLPNDDFECITDEKQKEE